MRVFRRGAERTDRRLHRSIDAGRTVERNRARSPCRRRSPSPVAAAARARERRACLHGLAQLAARGARPARSETPSTSVPSREAAIRDARRHRRRATRQLEVARGQCGSRRGRARHRVVAAERRARPPLADGAPTWPVRRRRRSRRRLETPRWCAAVGDSELVAVREPEAPEAASPRRADGPSASRRARSPRRRAPAQTPRRLRRRASRRPPRPRPRCHAPAPRPCGRRAEA